MMPSHFQGSAPPRKVAIAVDLSPDSAYAVRWAVENYLRPDDQVILLHVQPTSVLYGADWGDIDAELIKDKETASKMEEEMDAFTASKSAEIAKPLIEGNIPYKIHIVKDHDMKERICLEVERLEVSACIMGSRGHGSQRRTRKALLGSVSDYCVHHCDCPVVVVKAPDEDKPNEPLVVIKQSSSPRSSPRAHHGEAAMRRAFSTSNASP